MSETLLENKFRVVAIMSDLDIQLRGDSSPVGLSFEPDEAFVVRALLTSDGITAGDIGRETGFRELCGISWNPYTYETDAVNYCRTIITSLDFTLRVLKSTLLQKREGHVFRGSRAYRSIVFFRNPDYELVDERHDA